MARYFLKNIARGETELVSMGYILPNRGFSPDCYEESALLANAEVMGLKNKKMVEFVSESEYEKARKAEATKAPTVEDALDEDSPDKGHLVQLVKQARGLLDEIEKFVTASQPKAPAVKAASTSNESPVGPDDGLDLWWKPPLGLQPQSTTVAYLKKTAKEKREFLKTARDSSILRDIALFETDEKLKIAARKQVKLAEKAAEEAINLAETAPQ